MQHACRRMRLNPILPTNNRPIIFNFNLFMHGGFFAPAPAAVAACVLLYWLAATPITRSIWAGG